MPALRFTSLAAVLTFGLVAGCASGGGSTPPPAGAAEPAASLDPVQQATTIVVRNTQPGSVTINVFLVPDVGVDTPLGSIDAGQTKTFTFDGPPGRYTLRAVGSAGETVSNTFQLYRSSEATWDMSLGRNVRVGGKR